MSEPTEPFADHLRTSLSEIDHAIHTADALMRQYPPRTDADLSADAVAEMARQLDQQRAAIAELVAAAEAVVAQSALASRRGPLPCGTPSRDSVQRLAAALDVLLDSEEDIYD